MGKKYIAFLQFASTLLRFNNINTSKLYVMETQEAEVRQTMMNHFQASTMEIYAYL